MIKHIVCYSGGHSSALVAVECVRKFGASSVILLNHNLNASVECADVKRFKREISEYLGVPITYANIGGIDDPNELPDQFDVCESAKAFKVVSGQELCTNRLKTAPFNEWLANNVSDKDKVVIYYGFDANEKNRITRRSTILGSQGYRTDYPLAFWDRTIQSTAEIGIEPPMQYEHFKHANCMGCLKAGKQHWYVVYCTRPDIYERAKLSESRIGYTILREDSLGELEAVFSDMKRLGVPATEHINSSAFWSGVKKIGIDTSTDQDRIPCECIF